jgi:hypothetical protein
MNPPQCEGDMKEIDGVPIRVIDPDQDQYGPNFSTVRLRTLRFQQRTLINKIAKVKEVRRQKKRLSMKKWHEKPYIEE